MSTTLYAVLPKTVMIYSTLYVVLPKAIMIFFFPKRRVISGQELAIQLLLLSR